MELKDFIKNAIVSISEGITEGHGYIVDNNLGKGIYDDTKYVTFDIAVTNVNNGMTSTKLNVINSNTGDGLTYTNQSRINFALEINLKGVKNKKGN